MKKVLKVLGILAGVIVLLVVIGASTIHFSGIPTYEVKAPDLKVTGDSAMIAEGKRLSAMLCSNCHMAPNGKMEGKYMPDLPPEFGKSWSANITHHPESKLTGYTDGELAYLFRTGVKRDGSYAPPWMPKFPHLSDYDLHSIIAYLRSEQLELEASNKAQSACQPSFLMKFLCRVAFKPLPYPTEEIKAPPIEDKVAYGKYMATGKVDCFGCHSPSFETMNIMEPEKTPGFFSGGNPMPNLEGVVIPTANLTMDKETGIGNWTEEQFIKAVRFGQRPDGRALRYPMEPYAVMTEEEAATIWA
ncbi:MAG: c-type cytochrome, partial [Saprospiraceae bacterium]